MLSLNLVYSLSVSGVGPGRAKPVAYSQDLLCIHEDTLNFTELKHIVFSVVGIK